MPTHPLTPGIGGGLNESALVGLLAQWGLVERSAKAPSFVDGMSQWLGWEDAISLAGVLHAPTGPAVPARRSPAAALEQDLARLRNGLARSIDTPVKHASDDDDIAECRRRYVGWQQAMEAAVGPLRRQARAQAARQGGALARLAAMDAAMDKLLAPREQALLGQLPALLEQHHARAGGADRQQPDFRHDMRRLAHAELELRLQPVLGLLDALREHEPG